MTNWTFGGIGFATNLCRKTMLQWDKTDTTTLDLVFECQGHASVSEVLSSGIVSYSSENDYAGLAMVFATLMVQ